MSTKTNERLHTLDDDSLDEIGYPQTRLAKSIEEQQREPHRVSAPTKSPPPVLMPKPKHAIAPTQRLVQQPPPAISAPLTTTNSTIQSYNNSNSNGNISSNSSNYTNTNTINNNNNINNIMNNNIIQPRGDIQSTSQQSAGSSSNISPTYATPQASLSAESEADKKKLPNKSMVTGITTFNSKVIPSSTTTTAPSDNSHKNPAVRHQGILMRKNSRSNTTTPSSPSSLRKSLSATEAMRSSSSNPPYPSLQQDTPQQSRMATSTSNTIRQSQQQQQIAHADATHNSIHATVVSAAGTSTATAAVPSYNKVTFEDMQTKGEYNQTKGEYNQARSDYSAQLNTILEQNNYLRREIELLRRQQQLWHKSTLEMEKVKKEIERDQHVVTNRLEQLEEQLRHYCLIATGSQAGPSGARIEEKGKAVVHPTHSRSDPTTTSPRNKLNKPPSGGGRSPASKRHRSRSVPRFDEDGEHLPRYVPPPQPIPQPIPRRHYEEEYDYDYDDYPPQPETTDDEEEEEVGWEEYSSRRLPPPSFIRQHQQHQFRYPGPPPPPVVPLAGPNPSLPPPQLPPINRKWGEGRSGSLRRRRSGSLAPFLPRPPVPPHYHTLPPRHHHWRESGPGGYEGVAGDYGWEEPPPPSHRSSRYYDEPSDDFEDYPPPLPASSQKRYPHERRLPTARDRRSFPAYGTSM
ncbi:hypothetical protein BDA99DRAFT_503439 [Phascolomyces articulosus]|uniref:Uncharacterized protein n=1 Tax=Phascolomyces articulosus TaxID=60185 RepID=A0AAD5K4Z9_9FUNG|nr:hypothetical protein BDA99DRAFT_503439 [Phascolomyces articulosus]